MRQLSSKMQQSTGEASQESVAPTVDFSDYSRPARIEPRLRNPVVPGA